MMRWNASPRSWLNTGTPAWMYVGLSATVWALVTAAACGGGRSRPATPTAQAGRAPASADALCQAGEVQLREQAFAAAVDSLERCIAADPTRAYAYYYAGMAYRELDRVDRMADRFEMFVRLAPDAPERRQVETILDTLRR